MSTIVPGRTRGFLTIDNQIIDGLLSIGGIDAAGFYAALKRFIDRRQEAAEGQVMDWSVEAFCKKMKMGKDRFYRLMDLLWQVGLADVTKEIGEEGWKNQYVIHDSVEYEGPVRIYRAGSFRYQKKKPEESPEGGIPETGIGGIPESGIPGIPGSGIPAAGIPETGITKIQLIENTTNRKDKSLSLSSSNEEDKDAQLAFQAFELPKKDLSSEAAPKSEAQPSPAVKNQELIAELTAKLHQLPVEKLKGHYALIGRAYNQYGYQAVLAAIEDLAIEFLAAEKMGDPLVLSEKELARRLFARCRWNSVSVEKALAQPEGKEDEKKGERAEWQRTWKKVEGRWIYAPEELDPEEWEIDRENKVIRHKKKEKEIICRKKKVVVNAGD